MGRSSYWNMTGARRKSRRLRVEALERRRLLIGQGEVFEFTEQFDTSGLLGNVTAHVRWGDGSRVPASSVVGGNATGDLKIVFDYSLDSSGFFASASRRNLLQIAADTLITRMADSLEAIETTADHQWNVSIMHPSADPPGNQNFVEFELPTGPEIAENTIVVYAGARDLPGSVRGVGGPATSTSVDPVQFQCQSQAECDRKLADFNGFIDTVVGRGNAGAIADPPTDFAPTVGSISFDNQGTNWYFGLNEFNFPGGNQIDFLTVATHELAHVLGFGVTNSWARVAGGSKYSGDAANQAYQGDGPVPLQPVSSGTPAHWNQSVLDIQPSIMTGTLEFTNGQRTEFSELDFGGLEDVGWQPLPLAATVNAQYQFNVPGEYLPKVILTGSRAGSIVHSLAPITVTPVVQSMTAEFTSDSVREDSPAGVSLTLTRGDADVSSPLEVTVAGSADGQLVMPTTITIPADRSQHTIDILPVNDDVAELSKQFTFTFTADNHTPDSATVTVLDDEPPAFQNSSDRFDVFGNDGVRASDALRIINELARRGGEVVLDPELEQPGAVFWDVNGDYRVTALDALIVINELANRSEQARGELPWFVEADDEDDRLRESLHDHAITGIVGIESHL